MLLQETSIFFLGLRERSNISLISPKKQGVCAYKMNLVNRKERNNDIAPFKAVACLFKGTAVFGTIMIPFKL